MAERRSAAIMGDVVTVHTFMGTGGADGNAPFGMAWGEEWKRGNRCDLGHVSVLELPAVAVSTSLSR